MHKTAVMSECRKYRYQLGRRWGSGASTMYFIMLNPSTADHETDDPTIKRCIHFAQRERFDGLAVMNLFALRATNPADLWDAEDPVGPGNMDTFQRWLGDMRRDDSVVVCAWGGAKNAVAEGKRMRHRLQFIGVRPMCLGHTQAGAPNHPLYLRGDTPLIPWKGYK